MKMPWTAAGAALLAGALTAGGVEWTVAVKRAEVKPSPAAFERPASELELGDGFDGELQGDWVRITEKDKKGWVHRSALATKEEVLEDPPMSFRVMGTFYPYDLMGSDMVAQEWMRNPVVRETGPAPHAWGLEDFRTAGRLKGAK